MQFHLLKSKIHRATVTGGNVNYEGSLTIARDLMDKAGLLPYERILCSNMANGNRFETYAIPGEPGSGQIVLNGAAAHLGKKGDRLTIMNFTCLNKSKARKWAPRVIVLGKGNRIVNQRGL
ncbi:MAG: aspartate 1-decarboxylase [Verrucomicrobiota bacterium]|jgi:aspartate 1-decarboxylase